MGDFMELGEAKRELEGMVDRLRDVLPTKEQLGRMTETRQQELRQRLLELLMLLS